MKATRAARIRPMPRRQEFLGTYWPVRGWLHAVPTWLKFLVILVVSIALMLARNPAVNLGLIGFMLMMGSSAKLPLSEQTLAWRKMWFILGLFALFHVITGDLLGAAQVLTTMLACIQVASLLMLTTTVAQLLEFFRRLCTPLKWIGIDPELPALAATLTLRSVSAIADLTVVTGQAARARGLERNVRARTVPVVLGAVKYAQDTGRALDARGLVD